MFMFSLFYDTFVLYTRFLWPILRNLLIVFTHCLLAYCPTWAFHQQLRIVPNAAEQKDVSVFVAMSEIFDALKCRENFNSVESLFCFFARSAVLSTCDFMWDLRVCGSCQLTQPAGGPWNISTFQALQLYFYCLTRNVANVSESVQKDFQLSLEMFWMQVCVRVWPSRLLCVTGLSVLDILCCKLDSFYWRETPKFPFPMEDNPTTLAQSFLARDEITRPNWWCSKREHLPWCMLTKT